MKITKRKINASTKVVKASTASAADMLDAFEAKLAEFGVEASTTVDEDTDISEDVDISDDIDACGDIEASTDVVAKIVDIYDYDEDDVYEDVGGGFGEPGERYSMAEMKKLWNDEYDYDPSMKEYDSFDGWWGDTCKNGWVRPSAR